jgi:hypothetical protein
MNLVLAGGHPEPKGIAEIAFAHILERCAFGIKLDLIAIGRIAIRITVFDSHFIAVFIITGNEYFDGVEARSVIARSQTVIVHPLLVSRGITAGIELGEYL